MYVSKGNIKGIIDSLSVYKSISERIDKIGYVISTGYIQQLNFLAKKCESKPKVLLKYINRYISMFGNDDNILAYLDYLIETYHIEYDETELGLNTPSYTRWTTIELPEKIFEM